MPYFPDETMYSEKYRDDTYEYRHVTLCEKDFDKLPLLYKTYYRPENSDRLKIEKEYLSRKKQILSQGREFTDTLKQVLLEEEDWRKLVQ